MDLNALANSTGEWLRASGPESDIVMSSRIRLARNLAEFPFISRATDQDRNEIERQLRERILQIQSSGQLQYINVSELEGIDRQFLVERQLISREHAESHGARGVAIDGREQISLMINEEEHLRIQCIHERPRSARRAWEQINQIDDLIEELRDLLLSICSSRLRRAACPTNVGTGVRVSVMLHLPALVITKQIEKVFRSLQKISLAVRGLYGRRLTGKRWAILIRSPIKSRSAAPNWNWCSKSATWCRC